ncbi:MAG: ABC transporter ATP-binding protein [Geminicoccaceae bacterium]|nr:ABC transporter ATP-binding protein [Geminicoccaceae bacterium]MDW8326616.1 ABC transporter ATP-binding protein [Anaerolineales bacterium]
MNPQSILVQTHALTKVYTDGAQVRALDGVSLTIAAGEFLAILGPSGSGKSTLLHLIGTLDRPTSGQVLIDGVDVGTLRGDALADFRRAKIGFVFQLFNLVPTLNALENVMLPLVPYQRGLPFNLRARGRELLQRLGLADRLDHLPGQLSGGEQQRVAIARALVNHPKLILADEPTGNLDTKIGAEIVALLRQLNREEGLTLVVVTHDAAIAAQADRVVQLRDGRLFEPQA